jgi:hypothetical protein
MSHREAWRWVPVELTEDMGTAMESASGTAERWAAAVQAAPSLPEKVSEEQIERAARARYESRPVQNRHGGGDLLAWDDLGKEWQADECEAMRVGLEALR